MKYFQCSLGRKPLQEAKWNLFALLLAGFFSCSYSSGATVQIDWGTSAAYQELNTSNGSQLSLSEFSIELGAFDNGFIPTAFNTEDWVSNWRVFDAITTGDTDSSGPKGSSADGFVSLGLSSRFVGTGHLDTDQTSMSEDAVLQGSDSFAFGGQNLQAYVFIRNADTMTEGSEWLLYTSESGDEWQFPSGSATQQDFPNNWFISDVDKVVWGAVAEVPEGAGDYSDNSPSFLLRTHTVPEPESVLLLVLGVLLLSFVRRRS